MGGGSNHRIDSVFSSYIGSRVSSFLHFGSTSKYFSHKPRLFILALLMFSAATYAQTVKASDQPLIGLKGVAEIVRKLSAKDADPFSQEDVEDVTETKLIDPDTNYPPEVLEQLKRLGAPPPGKPAYIQGNVLVSKDMSLHIQLAAPSLILEFRSYGFPTPKVITNESLQKLLPKIHAYRDRALRNNCLKKDAVFNILDTNGWIFRKTDLTEKRDAVTGIFQFESPSRSSAITVTVERNCMESLMFVSWSKAAQEAQILTP